ncbi:MAG: hypothetical protein CSA29_02940 [Desulfobacterales bacterium]|nr:MAG: hypothetical protein CSA29_02940 [Desulfobacterales bacterium]
MSGEKMTDTKSAIFKGYINEIQGYIPVIKKHLCTLQQAGDDRNALNEVLRLIHSIRGASALVGALGVRRMAEQMENELEQCLQGTIDFFPMVYTDGERIVDILKDYCKEAESGDDFPSASLDKQIDVFCTSVASRTSSTFLGSKKEGADGDTSSDFLGDFLVEEDVFEDSFFNEFSSDGDVVFPDEMALDDVSGSLPVLDQGGALTNTDDLEILRQKIAGLENDTKDDDGITFETPHPIVEEQIVEEQRANTDSPQSSISTSLFSDEEQQLLQEGFFEEANEHMQEIYTALQKLDKIEDLTQINCNDDINTILRAVHTIKGAAAVIGLKTVSDYGHTFEDFLDWLHDGNRQLNREIFTVLAAAVDLLSRVVDDPAVTHEAEQKDLYRQFSALYTETDDDTKNADASARHHRDSQRHETLSLTADQIDSSATADDALIINEDKSTDDVTVSLNDAPPVNASALPERLLENIVDTMQDSGDIKTTPPVKKETSSRTKGQSLRINQGRFDRLMKLVNDLLVGVSRFDTDMRVFASAVQDLGIASQRLKQIAQDLEKNYEVKALDQISRHLSHIDELQSRGMPSTHLSEFDAMELDQYSKLHLIIRSLNESSVDFQTFCDGFGHIYDDIDGDISRQYQIIRELQTQFMRARLMPLSTLTPRLSRTVREVSSVLGKSVRLVMEGEWTEMDRLLWEKLADPLMHLLRNAIHHGIETDEQRVALGKPSVATIRIAGAREGNHVYIRCSDDGRGFDFDAIRKMTKALNIAEDVDNMTEEQLTQMVFHAGFSTKSVSQISGRGVGLDVVRQNVRELQGNVNVHTVPGQGTTFIIRIPLTMGVIRILQVDIGGMIYGIAMEEVKMIQRLSADQIDMEKGIVFLNNQKIPWFSLSHLIGVADDTDHSPSNLAVLVEFDTQLVGISIPEVIAQREVVIKQLSGILQGMPSVSGATVLGNGVIIPILNLPGLLRKALGRPERFGVTIKAVDSAKQAPAYTVMVVDDSISIRRVMGRMVTAKGWQVLEAKDGQYALELLETERPDCILLDIEMPRLNGFEFLTIKGNIEEYRDIPVVMLTSRSSEKHRKKAIELGACAFLNKPSDEKKLIETILQVAPHHGQSGIRDWETAASALADDSLT